MSWLDFFPIDRVGSTRRVNVLSTKTGFILGQIRWYAPWRQYSFFPTAETVWSHGCLDEVYRELRRMMEERRRHRAVGP